MADEIISAFNRGMNWCPIFNHEIDDELVNIMKPECIEKNNGCGNCKEIAYKVITEVITKRRGRAR